VQTGVANGLPVFSNGFPVAANPDIKWEETEQLDIGLEFTVLDNKVSATVDYFSKTTTDLIVTSFNPAQQQIFENLDAEVKSSGVEALVGAQILESASGFNLDVSANVTYYFENGEITNYQESPIPYGNLATPGVAGGGQPTQQIDNDTRIGEFYLPIFSFSESGGYSVSDGPLHTGKSAIPDIIYGLNLNATYKGFDLGVNFAGVADYYVLNATVNGYLTRDRIVNYNISESNIDKFPGGVDSNPTVFSDQLLEKGDHLRLNNVVIGYTLNTGDISWLESVRFFASGQNLLIFTDYTGLDPQVNIGGIGGGVQSYGLDNGVYPSPRTFTIGFDANF